jgi:hypothetical protein
LAILAFWLGVASCSREGPDANGSGTEGVLTKARAAFGWGNLEKAEAIRLEGRTEFRGRVWQQRYLLDKNGRLLEEVVADEGDFHATNGYDGDVFWHRDSTGVPQILDGPRVQGAWAPMLVFTGIWLSPSSRFKYELEAPEAESGEVGIKMLDETGTLVGRIVLDDETFLLKRFAHMVPGGEVWRLSQFGNFGGVQRSR